MADFLKEYTKTFLKFNRTSHILDFDDKKINRVFRKYYNKKLNIIWGYYEILRKDNHKIVSQYYAQALEVAQLKNLRKNVYNFKFIEVTTPKTNNGLYQQFIKNHEETLKYSVRDFDQKYNVSKSFQYLDYYNIDREAFNNSKGKKGDRISNEIHDWYKNTEIQKELDKHSFYVVLNEEIYFFLLLEAFFNNNNKLENSEQIDAISEFINIINKNVDFSYGLKQLLKFSTSIVLNIDIFDPTIENETTIVEKWKKLLWLECKDEISDRKTINNFNKKQIDSLIGNNDLIKLLSSICDTFLRKARIKFENVIEDNGWSNLEIIKWMSRAHLDPYKELLTNNPILPDFFVFPLFNNFKNIGENELKSDNLPFETTDNIKLNRPVLFNCYVKPIFEISLNDKEVIYDEKEETIPGFHITKSITKELAAPLVQSEFFGPLIGNLLFPQIIKSSLAAVMSRNMSHNIGSHVLNKLSSKDVVDSFFKPERGFINKDNSTGFKPERDFINEDKSIGVYTISPFFPKADSGKPSTSNAELFRVFNDYLKKRMDFVADVATSDRATLTNNRYLFNEVFKNFEINLLLLHNISGKDDKFKYRFNFKYQNKENTFSEGDQGFIDPIVAMPNDVLGDQAFYIILENIIRNTAKHSNENDVVFTIKVVDKHPDFYQIEIFDSVEYESKEEFRKLILDRNKSIAESIIDEKTSQIRSNGWGTIELKLAACYLSRVSTTNIEDYKYKPLGLDYYEKLDGDNESKKLENYYDFISGKTESEFEVNNWLECPEEGVRKKGDIIHMPLLQAIDGNTEINQEKGGFGYSFLLKKPQEVLVVLKGTELVNQISPETFNIIKRLGIAVYDFDTFKSINKSNENVWHHSILLSDCQLNITDKLPQRFKKLGDDEVSELLNILKSDESFKNNFILYQLKDFYFRDFSGIESVKWPEVKFLGDFQNEHNNKYQFDHHGVEVNKDAIYYEPYGSSSILQSYIKGKNDGFNQFKVLFNINRNSKLREKIDETYPSYFSVNKGEIIEAIQTKILVFDERIQALLNHKAFQCERTNKKSHLSEDYLKLAYRELFQKTNITVPLFEPNVNGKFYIDLNSKPFVDDEAEWVKLENYLREETKTSDYFVIHFGIIEMLRGKVYLKDENGVKKILKEAREIKNHLIQLLKETNCKLILTSGRGLTPDVKELELPFVSYSSFSNCLIDPNNRSKIHLTNLLKSARND